MARKELLSLGNETAVGCLMKALLSKRCTIVSKVQDAALTRLLEQSRRYTSESLSNTDTEAILKSAEEEGEGERAGNPILGSVGLHDLSCIFLLTHAMAYKIRTHKPSITVIMSDLSL